MADNKYCSTKFACGEDLDAALEAALNVEDNARRAAAAAESAVKTINGVSPDENGNVDVTGTSGSGVIAQPEQPTETGILWLDTDEEGDGEIPQKLPNPYALTFTGAVTGSYDGSAPLSVEIPAGGGSGGSTGWELINTITLEEDSNSVIIDKDSSGNSFDLSAFMLYIDRVASDLQSANSTLYIGNAPSGYFTAMHSQTPAQTRLWYMGEFAVAHGFKSASGNGASGNYVFSVSYAGNAQTHAPMIRLYNYYFGAGTKIYLYGVRK